MRLSNDILENPFSKLDPKDDVNNYRPISILPSLSKIIDKWIQIILMSYLNEHKLLHENQSGFRKNHSMESAHTYDIKLLMRVNWLDVLWWSFIKLSIWLITNYFFKTITIYKFSDKSLSWFKTYQSNRTQQVVTNDCSSVNGDVLCGIPQASVCFFLPLLFLIYRFYWKI